jgi:uncharacterized protein (TIGR03545 family)
MKKGIFRWRAIGVLIGLAIVVGIVWFIIAEPVTERTLESIGTRMIGARVEIEKVELGFGSASLQGVTVASPFVPLENLLEAEELAAEINLIPLLKKKVVIERLAATGMRFGTSRETDGRVELEGGRRGVIDPRGWSELFDFPALDLVTGEVSVTDLDPNDLYTVQQAQALTGRADSTWTAWQAMATQIEDSVTATVEAVENMLERLQNARLTDLGLINDARNTIEQVESTVERLESIEAEVDNTLNGMEREVAGLSDATQRDYDRARDFVRLPTIDAGRIAAAIFGPVAVERFQRGVYWSELARRYMPPGLKPRARPGPKRARASGSTVNFPRQGEYPGFLLELAELSFSLADDAPASAADDEYAGRLSGLTSAPAIYGRPTEAAVRAPNVVGGGLFDHTGEMPRDSLGATIAGLRLDTLSLGALPIRLATGALTTTFSFDLTDDQLTAGWSINADRVDWLRDSAGATNEIEDLIWRAVSGIQNVQVSAQLSGTLSDPSLAVSSNLDRAIADRIRAVAGEEIAAAESRLRAEVDRLVEGPIASAGDRVVLLRGQVMPLLAAQDERLAEAQRQLEERIRELTGGIRIPGS